MVKWPNTYAVFDIETDGLSTKTAIPTELAVMVCHDGIAIDSYDTLIWRSREQTISTIITDITGITNELCFQKGVPIAVAMNRFWSIVQFYPLIGHNIRKFDIPIIERFRPPWAGPAVVGVDTMEAFRTYMKNYRGTTGNFKSNLKVACAEFGIEQDIIAHRAMIDVEYNRQLYVNMRKEKAG